jgi:putative ABC transport system permease protein
MRYAEVKRIDQSGLARAVPLYVRFKTRHGTIVGTSLEYFEYRGLEIDRGRQFGILGECVLGAHVARVANAEPGSFVMSTPDSVFDIAGVYPLKMKVVGILNPTGTPDDHAVFVDIKTAWVIEGLAHGHQDLRQPSAADVVLEKDGNRIIANASVVQYNEITPENIDSFHFHGDPDEFPVTTAIAIPNDEKASTLIQGRYLDAGELVQIVRPALVMNDLLETILTVRRYILIAVALVGIATLASMVLVFMLSLQLRRRELETMIKIGGSKARIVSLIAVEILGVLIAGAVLAGFLSLLTLWLAGSATRLLVQSI